MTLINNNTIKNYTNRKIEPGLVAFYNIRPGNGAGLLLEPRSPHGASYYVTCLEALAYGRLSLSFISIIIIMFSGPPAQSL